MQKRLVRKRHLEMTLSKINPHPSPTASLEQYTIPPDVAAEMLRIAAYVYDDIINKTIADLGCGTGRLAIGALLLGAKKAVGIDIDKTAVKIAKENAKDMSLQKRVDWVVGDIEILQGHMDTVLQNPPFGVQKRRADRKFLKKALALANVTYSLHKGGTRNRLFLKKFIEECGGKVTGVFNLKMSIPRMFEFHKKKSHVFQVDLYRIEGEKKCSILNKEADK
ncbi:MAG: METTL5 family protein [Candidatus Bathyarchaeia archaeon]